MTVAVAVVRCASVSCTAKLGLVHPTNAAAVAAGEPLTYRDAPLSEPVRVFAVRAGWKIRRAGIGDRLPPGSGDQVAECPRCSRQ